MPKKIKEVAVIEHESGTKFVAKKTSVITRAKWIFAILSILWLTFAALAPLYVKNKYGENIKKSIVVSMFFDLQRNIQEQYAKLLDGIKDSIDLSKPIGIALDKVKMAQGAVGKVTDTTAKASETTAAATAATDSARGLTGLAGRFGIDTSGVDKVIDSAAGAVGKADNAIAKVDNTAAMVNTQLDKVKTELVRVSQTEVDKMIDDVIKSQLDKYSGGLGTTLLTDYGIEHVYPWRPSSWGVATRIYNDLEKSNLGVLNILTNTVNKYFGYVAWGLVVAAWLAGLFVWSKIAGWYKVAVAPFIVCPRCGYTITDKKRLGMSLLKIVQPWTWFGL